MYFTFLTEAKPEQITFEEILKNPYLSFVKSGTIPLKKVTLEVTDEYAETYWNKNGKKPPDILKDMEEIKTIDTSEHYRHFEIPKKTNPNKKRPIDAPDEILSSLQTSYASYIKALRVIPHKAAHAYVEERSTITAMKKHQENDSKWYLQIDLKNFFNSINKEFLERMLMKVYPFSFIEKQTFDNIVKLSLLNGELPQGSHLSPLLTNIVMIPIDHDINETLHNYKRHHYVYTRYADDITISCKEKFDAKEIENVIKSIFDKWEVPFRINEEKTRFGSTAGRNFHLGIIVNKDNKLSIGHEKNQKFRAKIYNYCQVGNEWALNDLQKLLGLISYYRTIEPEFIRKTLFKYSLKFGFDIEKHIKKRISSWS